MKPASPPVVSPDTLSRTEALLRRYVPQATSAGAGAALTHAFASLADAVAERVNRVPEKNLLAFLELIGVRAAPPQVARAPLTFTLAAGATTDVVVPARSRVSAVELPGEREPAVFETDRGLVVTAAVLEAVRARDPARDRVADNGAGDGSAGPFGAFSTALWIDHLLYVGHDDLFGLAERSDVHVLASGVAADAQWPWALLWERWDGSGWIAHPARVQRTEPDVVASMLIDLPRVPRSTVAGVTTRWVRARLATSIPRLGAPADMAAMLRRSGVLPDALWANDAAVDPRLPVTPFATADKKLYVRVDEAFSKPGARVSLNVRVDAAAPAQPSGDLKLQWQWFDGAWKTLGETPPSPSTGGVVDSTGLLVRDGSISFTVPLGWLPGGDPLSVASREPRGLWLLVRVASGSYGSARPTITRLDVGYDWPRPRLRPPTLTARVARTGRALDQAFSDAMELDTSKDFLPFGALPAVGDTLYVACDDALEPPRQSIDVDVALTTPLIPAPPAGVVPPPAAPQHGLLLKWEYYDAVSRRWTALGESGPGTAATASFSDATEAFTKNGVVRLAVPRSIGEVAVNGVVRRWLRVRIARGDYGGLTATTVPQPPSVRSMTTAYSFASTVPSATMVLVENDFAFAGTAPDAAGLITPFTPSVDREPTLYLGFDRPFSNQAIALYFAVQDAAVVAEAAPPGPGGAPPVVVWEFWDGSASRWSRLETRDETRSFTRRGLVSFVGPPSLVAAAQFGRTAHWLRARWIAGAYGGPPTLERVTTNTVWGRHETTVVDEVLGSSTGQRDQVFRATRAPVLDGERLEVRELDGAGDWTTWQAAVDFHVSGPGDRHYVLDRATGEVRFGDGVRGRVPPRGRDNVRLARYRTGGGEAGNRPRATISRLLTTVPYVDAVTNLEAAAGGIGAEQREALVERGPRVLRHGGRAVVAGDFEDLALEASAEVARATAIVGPSRSPLGRVGVVIVPRSQAARPVPSSELAEHVEGYLRERSGATFDLWVRGPGWLRVDVEAEVVPVSIEQATDVENAVRLRVQAFLHPLTGGQGDGWAIGRRVFRSDVEAVVHATPGVDHVRVLRVTEQTSAASPAPGAFLIHSGEHRIRIGQS